MRKTFTMFAAVNERQDNLICVNWYAVTVRSEAGLLMNEDATIGWKTLLREGWRVRKVRIQIKP